MLHVRSAALSAALALVAAPASGQSAGDTLRYHEWTESWSEATGPGGEFVQHGTHDAWITVAWITADSAHAWYDSLSVGQMDHSGEVFPDVREIYGQIFVLRFTDDGAVETLATPVFPETLKGVTDLSFQFHDFFVPVPADLGVGVEWSDTTSRTNDDPATTLERTRIASFTIAGDTVVDEVPAWVIETTAPSSTIAEGAVEGFADLRYRAESDGGEDGLLLLAKEDARLLFRTRSAESTGTIRYTGSRTIPEISTRDGYFSEIVLLDR